MDKIEKLMLSGWDVLLECKGSTREFSMSYEAHATNVEIPFTLHAVADSIEDIGSKLTSQLSNYNKIVS